MRLVVKKANEVVKEFKFAKGPIYIGRHVHSQIFLPGRTVSRQHAVIFSTHDGKWMVEDLDSANKTYLNDEPIHKTEIKNGDVLRITDFTIEITFEDNPAAENAIDMEDTLTKTVYGSHAGFSSEIQTIVRRPDAEHAPDIKLPAKRAKDFVRATEAICKADGLDEVLKVLLDIAIRQFRPYHIWCALRNQTSGPMTCHAGKKQGGQTIQLSEIKLSEKINEAVEKGQFLLFPRIPAQADETGEVEKIRSAMIVPIIGESSCFGVLYVDNDMAHEHYGLGDLDYAMLLAIHTAAIVENF